MKIRYSISWIVFLVFSFFSSESLGFRIVSTYPEPNYARSSKQYDYRSLSDAEYASKKMWEARGAFVWYQATPVTLDVELTSEETGGDGIVRVHTSIDRKKDLGHFQRIDIYSRETPSETYRHSGGAVTPAPADDGGYWIRVPVNSMQKHVKIVLHPVGIVVALDEIEVLRPDEFSSAKRNLSTEATDDPVDHSFKKLIKSVSQKKIEGPGGPSRVVIDAFSAGARTITGAKSYSKLDVAAGHILYITFQYENVNLNPVDFCLEKQPGVDWFTVEKVATVTGKERYDPIIPLGACAEVDASSTEKMLLKIDALKVSSQGKLVLASADGKVEHEFDYAVSDGDTDCALKINPWAYSVDKPIWSENEAMINQLSNSGVNVFWIAPSRIPSLLELRNKKKTKQRIDALQRELGLFEGRGEVILVLGIDSYFRSASKLLGQKKEFTRWVATIISTVRQSGIAYEDFSLSLVDEARGAKLRLMLEASRITKQVDSAVRIYANPLLASNLKSDYATLKALKPLIDIWQPRKSFLKSVPEHSYRKESAALWMYDNPAYPAKDEDLEFYRSLPVEAVKAHAGGVAFWALTDTRKTSAFSDIDGVRPDWAVLYEGADNGPYISSMRWEAFQQGVREACALMRNQ